MKKSIWITIIVIAIVLILVIGLGIYYFYNLSSTKEKEIENMNKAQFSFLKCISACPIVHSDNKTAFKASCMSSCSSGINPTQYSKKYPNDQLIKDPDYMSCTNKIDLRDAMTLEKYENCLSGIIPKLQEKYSYLKGI